MESSVHLIHLLKNAAACCERELQAGLGRSQLSVCQTLVLEQIEQSGESMSKLSKALCCHKSNITQIVDHLVKAGMAEREPCKTDRRVSHLKLTAKGKKALASSKEIMRRQAMHCFKTYSTGEKQDLQVLLRKFVDMHMHAHKE